MTAPHELQTPRLALTRVRADDLADLVRFYADPDVTATLGGVRTAEWVAEYLQKQIAHWDEHGLGFWTLRDPPTGRFVGRGGLRHATVEGRPRWVGVGQFPAQVEHLSALPDKIRLAQAARNPLAARTMKHLLRGLAAFALALSAAPAFAQDVPPPPLQDGVTVQPRGPVHEAFARPADVSPRPAVVPRQPPPPIKEVPPDQRPAGDNVQWVPGYWSWDDEAKDFLWVSGCWRVPPPGRTWVTGRWAQVNGGWQRQPGVWAGQDAAAPQQLNATPPRSLEVGPSTPAPDDDSYYVPGQWVYQNDEWAWQPGGWVKNPANMVYQPPAYLPDTQGGSLYVPGYWDYPLQDRGQLYAPATFAGAPWVGNPGWAYTPSYGVGLGGLFGSLFVRPNYGSYYFGNYFGSPYRGLGYTPWTAYGRRGYDPLLNYYGWSNRGTAGWYGGLNGLYAGRLNGSLPVPAISLSRPVAHAAVSPAVVNRNTANFHRNLSVNPVNSLQTVHHIGQHYGNAVRLPGAAPRHLTTSPGFQPRQSFSSPSPVRSFPSLPSPAASGLRPPVSLPGSAMSGFSPGTVRGFSSPAAPAFRSAPRMTVPHVQHAAPTFRAAPTFHAAPTFRSAPAHHAMPAMRGPVGHVGGGHGGGGHVGGHGGGGHRR
jgi:hypothetical protein